MPSKSRGSLSVISSLPRQSLRYEYQWYYSGGWKVRYREVPETLPAFNYYHSDQEAISYGCGLSQANACDHTRIPPGERYGVLPKSFKASIGSSTSWEAYGADRYGSAIEADITSWCNGAPGTNIPSIPAYDWSGLVGDVGAQMRGRLSSSCNILVEAVQLAQVYRMLKNPFNYGDVWRFRKKLLSLGKLAKTSANAWLEYRYGWRNLFLLVNQLASMYQKSKAHYDYLQMSANRYTHVAASDSVTSTWSGLLPKEVGSYGSNYSCYGQKTRISYTRTFGLDVLRPPSASQFSLMDIALQYLGANDIIGALWDLTPFSFVADWFIGLDKWLHRDPVFLSSFNIRRACWSIKAEYFAIPHVRQQIRVARGTSALWDDPGPEKCIYKRYIRSPGFPPATGASNWTGLKTTQLLDGAALIVQRL